MDLYRQEILEHFKNPQNEGKIENADVEHEENNPLCGDEITVYLNLDGDSIKDIKFKITGCAISKASASMVSEVIKEKSKKEICSMGLEDVKKIMGIPLTSSREKCAMINLEAIKKAIKC